MMPFDFVQFEKLPDDGLGTRWQVTKVINGEHTTEVKDADFNVTVAWRWLEEHGYYISHDRWRYTAYPKFKNEKKGKRQ